jgi:O-antigen/teichoic acid export membrane protein
MDITRELLIAFFILLFYSKNILGSYDFSFKMLKLPLTILGASIGQVYFQKIAFKKNNGESINEITFLTIKNLFLISIVPFSIIYFYGEELFTFVFGKDWQLAGKYSEIMAPWLMVNLVSSPISHLPIVLGKLRTFFWVGFTGSILLLSILIIPFFNSNLSFELLLKFINYSQSLFLIFVLIWFIKLSRKH